MKKSKILILVAMVGLIGFAFANRDKLQVETLQAWVESAGALGPLVFVAVYVFSTVLFLPATILTLLGGFLFGPVGGTLLNLTGATIGSSIAFMIARYTDGGWIRSKAGDGLGKILDRIDAEGWRAVAFFRLVPIFPFNVLNYAFGLSKIPFVHCVIATVLCMAPATAAYTFFGHTFGLAFSTEDAPWIKYLIAGLVLVAGMLVLTRFISKKDKEKEQTHA